MGCLKNHSTFCYENHHQYCKKDVESKSRNLSITSFNLNSNFIETDILNIQLGKLMKENNFSKEYAKIILNSNVFETYECGIIIEKKNFGIISNIIILEQIKKIIFQLDLYTVENDDYEIMKIIKENKRQRKYIDLCYVEKIYNIFNVNGSFFLMNSNSLSC